MAKAWSSVRNRWVFPLKYGNGCRFSHQKPRCSILYHIIYIYIERERELESRTSILNIRYIQLLIHHLHIYIYTWIIDVYIYIHFNIYHFVICHRANGWIWLLGIIHHVLCFGCLFQGVKKADPTLQPSACSSEASFGSSFAENHIDHQLWRSSHGPPANSVPKDENKLYRKPWWTWTTKGFSVFSGFLLLRFGQPWWRIVHEI